MKGRNPLVLLLVLIVVLVAFLLIYMAWSDGSEMKTVGSDVKKQNQKLALNSASPVDKDTLPTEFAKVVNDLQGMQNNVEKLTDAVNLLKADNKAKEAVILGLKKSAEDGVETLLPTAKKQPEATETPIPIKPKELSEPFDPTKAEKEPSNNLLDSIVPPLMSNKPDNRQVDPNQIVWIKPLDSGYVEKKGFASSSVSNQVADGPGQESTGLLDEVGSKAKKNLGIEAGTTPYWTIPNGSMIAESLAVTAFVGRIPVNGQLQDPWRFKISTGQSILMPNDHEVQGLQKTIVQGTAIGSLGLRCVTGRIDTLTFVFTDGRIVTHEAKNKKDGMGYITDAHANPCIPGELITNAPAMITQMGILGAAEGITKGVADNETQSVTTSDGSVIENVVGDHVKKAGYEGLSSGIGEIKKWAADRLGQYFDVIYVPAGKIVDIHIMEEIRIDYDPMGRKVSYENASDANHGYLD